MSCKVFIKELEFSTEDKFQVIPITSEVASAVRESGIKDGYVLVFAPHATAAVILNEYEPRIASDYVEWIKKCIPPNHNWRHNEIDNNAHAHIASALIGPSRILPVREGEILRGTWQEILFLELDGPRARRKILIQVMGC